MKFKKELIYSLKGVLEQLKKTKAQPKFHYCVIKNLKLILPEFETLEELRESMQVKGWSEYVQKEHDLLMEYSEKDESGKPIAVGPRSYKLKEDTNQEFFEKKKTLDEENKELIKEYFDRQKEFENIVKEEIEMELWKIDIDLMPTIEEGGEVVELFEEVGILE